MATILLAAYIDGAARARRLTEDGRQTRLRCPTSAWFSEQWPGEPLTVAQSNVAVLVHGVANLLPGRLSDDLQLGEEDMFLQDYFTTQICYSGVI
eukprot:2019721-Lingulodinium_polyedra.AAC.1